MDGVANILVSAAAAYIAPHHFVDIGVRGLLVLRQQCGGGHNLPGLAVAALRNVAFEPGALHGMISLSRKSFNGGNGLPRDARNRGDAGPNRLSIQMDGAGSAQCHAASEFRSSHTEVVTQ